MCIRDRYTPRASYRVTLTLFIIISTSCTKDAITNIKTLSLIHILDVNLGGVFYCCQQAVEHMMWNRRGCIINISSIWGMAGGACEAHYSAAKAGIIGLTKALAKEAGQWNIRINCIAPGVIDTDMNAGLSREDINEITAQTPLGLSLIHIFRRSNPGHPD